MIHNDIVLRQMFSACFKYTVMGDVVVTFRDVKCVFVLDVNFGSKNLNYIRTL